MAAVFNPSDRQFVENPGRIDGFRLLTDISRAVNGVVPDNLNFDVRQLPPGEYCSAYHFHRDAEELFVILSGTAKLRTPKGLQSVSDGDIIFFEKGEGGAHQLYNHSDKPCIYLDVRTYLGHDICEYPDSNKLYIIPTGEIFRKDSTVEYFTDERNVPEIWKSLEENRTHEDK
jgi:uncharacterized cupin superfamily protein